MNRQDCPFCVEFQDIDSSEFRGYFPENVLANRIIETSENFVALASLGSFVEGILLILTKQHITSFAQLSSSELIEAQEFKNALVRKVHNIFGTPIIFEHGVMDSNNSQGSCIDHAHLHLIPSQIDIFPQLSSEFEYIKINHLSELSMLQNTHQPYIFYEKENNSYVFLVNHAIPSQYSRRIIAEQMGFRDAWDWTLFPGERNIINTVKKLNST